MNITDKFYFQYFHFIYKLQKIKSHKQQCYSTKAITSNIKLQVKIYEYLRKLNWNLFGQLNVPGKNIQRNITRLYKLVIIDQRDLLF